MRNFQILKFNISLTIFLLMGLSMPLAIQAQSGAPLAVRYSFEKEKGFPWKYASPKLQKAYFERFSENEKQFAKQRVAKQKEKLKYKKAKDRAKRDRLKKILNRKKERDKKKRDRAKAKRDKDRAMKRKMDAARKNLRK